MKKLLLTTACDPKEPWAEVLAQTHPRMLRYAARHGYDFLAAWYPDVADYPAFAYPDTFVAGAVNYDLRADFIRWKLNRAWLAPNWIRYAATLKALSTYDAVVYLDGDVLIAYFDRDVLDEVPADKWLAASICGPSPDNAGPGGPMFATRSCLESVAFWAQVWIGRKWIAHPWWTDGVDFMDLLGYSIMPPVHKERETEYDASFHRIPDGWIGWGAEPARGARFLHVSEGDSGNAGGKLANIQRIIAERGL